MEDGPDPGADRAMETAWRSARRAGLAAAITGGLSAAAVCVVTVAIAAEALRRHGGLPKERVAIGVLVAVGLSFGAQAAFGALLQSRSAAARCRVTRRLCWLGAAGVMPLLLGLYLFFSMMMFVVLTAQFPGGGGAMQLGPIVACCGGIGTAFIVTAAWPWWVFIRHRGWLEHLAASAAGDDAGA